MGTTRNQQQYENAQWKKIAADNSAASAANKASARAAAAMKSNAPTLQVRTTGGIGGGGTLKNSMR